MGDVASDQAIDDGLLSYPNGSYGATGNLGGRAPGYGGDASLTAAPPALLTRPAQAADRILLIEDGRSREARKAAPPL